LEKLRAQTETLETERDECEEGMTKLKAVLYAKFGSECSLCARGSFTRLLGGHSLTPLSLLLLRLLSTASINLEKGD
jgi:hypothetical protein